MKDGQPFKIMSGSMHYWRVRPEDWRTRLELARTMGLNSITTYLPSLPILHREDTSIGLFTKNSQVTINCRCYYDTPR